MEPQIPNSTLVPLPPDKTIEQKEFKKSKIILVLAYLQVTFYIVRFLLGSLNINLFSLTSAFFLIPAIIIIFTKNESLYKIAKILLIIELLYIIISFSLMLLVFFNA